MTEKMEKSLLERGWGVWGTQRNATRFIDRASIATGFHRAVFVMCVLCCCLINHTVVFICVEAGAEDIIHSLHNIYVNTLEAF